LSESFVPKGSLGFVKVPYTAAADLAINNRPKSWHAFGSESEPVGDPMKLSRIFPCQPKGFTLMELMAALGVAAILMAIAIPNFMSTLPGLRLNDAARQVATDLQQLRMKAIAQNLPYQISFSTTTYVLQKCSGSCTNESGNIVLPQGITVTANTAPQFQPRGTVASATTIQLSNGSSNKWVCVRTVGRVNIQDTVCS
jgi:prepilin-type N-terminal cleavage/methylation domain-containing protein